MSEVVDAFKNGVPVDFRVSFSNTEIFKMVGVIVVLTVAVIIISNVVKNSFFK